MKNNIVLIILINVSLICSAQSTRNEVIEKISIVSEIIENSDLIIKTSNFNQDKEFIEAGIFPLIISTYGFEKEGSNQPLVTVEDIYYHTDKLLVSKFSNEQNPKRQDYETFWLSQIATHTYGDVLQNSEGLYYTKQVWFNLE
tara:strand:+ start:108 stop:536 length:429 start_codon:yes stop_codon:yes gene_type:complete